MAEPITVVPALNTMILLCVLLAFGASVSRFSWVVQVVSRTVLLVLITIAWLSQPMSKIQKLVSQLWGHDTYLLSPLTLKYHHHHHPSFTSPTTITIDEIQSSIPLFLYL